MLDGLVYTYCKSLPSPQLTIALLFLMFQPTMFQLCVSSLTDLLTFGQMA